MNDVLERIDLEVRIAATTSVREHLETGESEPEPAVMEAVTDTLIHLRAEQIDRLLPTGA